MKHRKRMKMKQRAHKMLFDTNLPFQAKVERDRTKYNRKQKHKKDVE